MHAICMQHADRLPVFPVPWLPRGASECAKPLERLAFELLGRLARLTVLKSLSGSSEVIVSMNFPWKWMGLDNVEISGMRLNQVERDKRFA